MENASFDWCVEVSILCVHRSCGEGVIWRQDWIYYLADSVDCGSYERSV